MKNVYIYCEGQTEESFVKEILRLTIVEIKTHKKERSD